MADGLLGANGRRVARLVMMETTKEVEHVLTLSVKTEEETVVVLIPIIVPATLVHAQVVIS